MASNAVSLFESFNFSQKHNVTNAQEKLVFEAVHNILLALVNMNSNSWKVDSKCIIQTLYLI